MEELKEKAIRYAEENVNIVMKEAFAKVYADGYRDGYKDCKEEIPVDLRDNTTEFVDLGLPSGTLWANDYEKESDGFIFLPYERACGYNLPNIEQLKELINICKWNVTRDSFKDIVEVQCVGPNGNFVNFTRTGYIKVDAVESKDYIGYFWIKEDKEEYEKSAGCFSWNKGMHISKEYSGYKLPIRLVRMK